MEQNKPQCIVLVTWCQSLSTTVPAPKITAAIFLKSVYVADIVKKFNKNIRHHYTVVCFAPKTDIPYIWVKMKVKKLIFFMTNQIVLDPRDSAKLFFFLLWERYSSCYDPRKRTIYPKNIWKMATF